MVQSSSLADPDLSVPRLSPTADPTGSGLSPPGCLYFTYQSQVQVVPCASDRLFSRPRAHHLLGQLTELAEMLYLGLLLCFKGHDPGTTSGGAEGASLSQHPAWVLIKSCGSREFLKSLIYLNEW